ncbi:RNA polymerase sigma factor [Paenibacillus marinisediminis]
MRSDELEHIYKLYYRDVYLYALSFCMDVHIAESLTSDTFYKALMSVETASSHMKQWLFRVCKHNYIDLIRKSCRHPSVELNEHHFVDDGHVLDSYLCGQQRKTIYKAIIQLANPYRECILLHYFFDYSLQDIAEQMGVSAGAVRTTLYRARKKLKDLLKEELL